MCVEFSNIIIHKHFKILLACFIDIILKLFIVYFVAKKNKYLRSIYRIILIYTYLFWILVRRFQSYLFVKLNNDFINIILI